jgi:molybdenum cofactor cytidylyltransferase
MSHSVILLAAGYSSRMGTLKALLPWDGLPLIEYQIRQLMETSFTDIIVVLGYESNRVKKTIEKYPVQIVINNNYAYGKTSSIKEGINALPHETQTYLIVSVDTPIDAQTVENMLQHFLHTQANIIIPVNSGKRGHPILIDACLKKELLSITEEKMGLKEILETHHSAIGELEVEKEHILFNLNSKEDYQSYKSKFERRN